MNSKRIEFQSEDLETRFHKLSANLSGSASFQSREAQLVHEFLRGRSFPFNVTSVS